MPFEANEKLQTTEDARPVTMGHEASGIVVQAGANATEFKPGQEVGFICAKDSCFECKPCKEVHNLWCEKGTAKMQGFALDGFFQEYVVVDRQNTMVLPPTISAKEAAPLFCAGVTAFNGIDGLKLTEGSWVAVVGCGGLGHLGIQYAKAMGYRVIGLDITEAALEEALASGAEQAFNSTSDDFVAKILELTGGGVAAAVNFTASKRAYDAMPSYIKPTGVLMAVGIPNEPVAFNIYDISLGRFQLRGANNGTCYTMPKCIEFSGKHGIKAHSEYYKLEDLPQMVEKMQQHKARGRLAVLFD